MGPKDGSAIDVSFAFRFGAGCARMLVAANENVMMALYYMAGYRETCMSDMYLRV